MINDERRYPIERQPHNPDDNDRGIPERERLSSGEIDLTGAVDTDEDLADVIGDALFEAEARGALPDWGARPIARALANEYSEGPTALHHFAATGRVDLQQLSRELALIYSQTPEQHEVRTWVGWLTRYIQAHSVPTDAASTEADRAQLDPLLDRVGEALQQHGAAFRAYLRLPTVDIDQPDLLKGFQDYYVGSFDSMAALVDELTDARACMEAVREVASRWDFANFITLDYRRLSMAARETWNVVFLEGRLYVFLK